MKTKYIVGLVIVVLLVLIFKPNKKSLENVENYNPTINPGDFVTDINNKYFTLTPGTTFAYEGETEGGRERIEVSVLNERKDILGVSTVVVTDKVYLDGALIEDTIDWYAQDKDGNVWYFGEETAEYENGKVTTTAGSWEAGVNNAKPGIIMKANPKIGDSYWQEYLKGEAEDRADVLAIDENVKVPFGSFTGCLKTYDYTGLDPSAKENKYYCPEVGGIALEVDLGNDDRIELISVKK